MMFGSEEFRRTIQNSRSQRQQHDVDDSASDLLEQISERQEEWLLPLKEDLSNWLNKTLGESHITASNFMDVLDNGTFICRLAKLIADRSYNNLCQKFVPPFKFKWWKNARSQSFFARDNTENFLRWCRQLGINEAVMFESESLVLHTQPRTVVLCLLELARIAEQCGIEPPGIVKLEKEIDCKLNDRLTCSASAKPRRPISVSVPTTPCSLETSSVLHKSPFVLQKSEPTTSSTMPAYGSCRRRSSTTTNIAAARPSSSAVAFYDQVETDSKLHCKILQIAGVCCTRSHVKRVSGGRYVIGGKTVFIRLLNDRHVMVRVGGGWDTLEHFIAKHDPCCDISSAKLVPDPHHPNNNVVEQSNATSSKSSSSRPSKSCSSSSITSGTFSR